MTNNIHLVIVHPGPAHMDELTALALALNSYPMIKRIERRDPTPEELEDPTVLVLDVGRVLDAEKLNFDHHQFERGTLECAASLLAKHLGYHDDLVKKPWYQTTIFMDCRGPFATAKKYGVEIDVVRAFSSPITGYFLRQFGDQESIFEDSWIFQFIKGFGADIIADIGDRRERLALLRKKAEIVSVKGIKVIFFTEDVENPPFAMEDFREENGGDAGISVSCDERGSGFSLFRFEDHPKVDFTKVKDDVRIAFAHANGFLATTKDLLEKKDIIQILETAILDY